MEPKAVLLSGLGLAVSAVLFAHFNLGPLKPYMQPLVVRG
jgi:hypothetical protein